MLTFQPHKGPVHALAFSPDGARLATTSCFEPVSVRDLADLTEVIHLPFTGILPRLPLAFSPDGRFLARGGVNFAMWNLDTYETLVSGLTANAIAFSPDGKEVAAFGLEFPLERWALPRKRGEAARELPGGWGGPRTRDRYPTGAMAYSPDGRNVALCYGVRAGRRFEPHLLVFGRNTGKPRLDIPLSFPFGAPAAIAYSPDGGVIAGVYGPVLGVVSAKTGEAVRGLRPGKKHFTGFAFTPDGRRLVAVNNDAAVRVYDTATWTETTGYEWQIGKLTAVAVAPDGLRAACGSDGGRVVVWDLDA